MKGIYSRGNAFLQIVFEVVLQMLKTTYFEPIVKTLMVVSYGQLTESPCSKKLKLLTMTYTENCSIFVETKVSLLCMPLIISIRFVYY